MGITRNRLSCRDLVIKLEQKYQLENVRLVDSGRSALGLALKSIKNNTGRIALPAYTCPILYEIVLASGFTPVPIDVDYNTLQMQTSSLLEEIKNGVDAVIAVHLFGDPISIEETKQCTNDTLVIEDCAQAIGALDGSVSVGAKGDFAIFSFGIGKVITGGIGGALATREEVSTVKSPDPLPSTISQVTKSFFLLAGMKFGSNSALYSLVGPIVNRNYHSDDKKQIERILSGHPSVLVRRNLPNSTCKVIFDQMERINDIINVRRINARVLTELLRDGGFQFTLTDQARDGRSIFTRYIMRVQEKKRTKIESKLRRIGVDADSPYSGLLSLFGSFGSFPNSERLVKESLAIPIHNRLGEKQLHKIAEGIIRAGAD